MILRWPGAKCATDHHARLAITRDRAVHLCEPFAGSAAVSLRLMREHLRLGSRVTLADVDPGIVALWRAVRDRPDELADEVLRVEPSVDLWRECAERSPIGDDVADALAAIVVNRLSFSGRGRDGGPLGGWHQAGRYGIGDRWYADRVCRGIRAAHLAMRGHRVDVVLADGAAVLASLEEEAVAFVDPPYYRTGRDMYQHAEPRLHADLARVLRRRRGWVLCYDDAPEVRAMYAWARVEVVEAHYSLTAASDRRTSELVIAPPHELPALSRGEETRLGMARARAAGAHVGRPRAVTKPSRVRRLRALGWSWSEIAGRLGASPSACRRAAARGT